MGLRKGIPRSGDCTPIRRLIECGEQSPLTMTKRSTLKGWLATFTFLSLTGLAVAGEVVSVLPGSCDLRPSFAEAELPLRLQGGRGTCSVFTMAGGLEYALAQQRGKGPRLSVEYLNWASNEATHDKEDGSFFSDLWTGFAAYGICTEPGMPYQDKYDAGRRPSAEALAEARGIASSGLRMHWIKPWNVETGLTDAEFQEIKKTLVSGWPVCGGFRWPREEKWQEGTLEMTSADKVFDGHSVLLVGYRDDASQPGGGVFLIRNSGKGSAGWAMNYEYVRAYMNDAVWIDFRPKGIAHDPDRLRSDLTTPHGAAILGRNKRVSSNQQPGWHTENLDMNWLMPGKSVEMPVLAGPGVITHMWFTSHAGWVGELNALVLRIYYDGSSTPAVEVPLGDFFAVGHGRPAVVESVPVQVSPTGSLSCYWRMPFRHSARITVTNDNPDRSTGLYWQVDWTQLDELPPETPYFYAAYQQGYPPPAGRDYTFADLEGKGHYVGTVLSTTMTQDGWFGEGDDFFYIDGETVPSLQGTGSEDYFNDAWGFRTRTGPWFGQPRWQGDRAGDSGVCYRWHLLDPVNFSRSLKFDMEHRGNCEDDLDGFFVERRDFLSSVAFWYQTGTPKKVAALPGWHARRVPWQTHHFVKSFQQAKSSNRVRPEVQTTGFFGARPVLLWTNQNSKATLTFPFTLPEAGRYAVRLTAGQGPEGGTYDVALDGRKVLVAPLRAAEAGEADLLLGTYELAAGEHHLTFTGPSKTGPKGSLVIEALRTLKLPPEVKRTVRTHHEAHFVRLGIGRAVYAYRLAYGQLPDSLLTLVRSGIMPERYSKDENGNPLRCKVEGGWFEVESPVPGGWKHRWQGLDARR
jgi:hypothetical protein